MKTAILTICTLLCLNLTLLAQAGSTAGYAAAAKTAAASWLQLVDGGQYAQSWEQMSPLAQARIKNVAWVGYLKRVRTPLGKVLSRRFKGATYIKNPVGSPAGIYEVLHYITNFTNMRPADETVSMVLGKDNKWQAFSFQVKAGG